MPTDANGMYAIAGIPEGRYIVGVTSAPGRFQPRLRPLREGRGAGQALGRARPGRGGRQTRERRPAKKKGFFSTVAGRVLVVSVVGVGLYFLIVDNEPSPIR